MMSDLVAEALDWREKKPFEVRGMGSPALEVVVLAGHQRGPVTIPNVAPHLMKPKSCRCTNWRRWAVFTLLSLLPSPVIAARALLTSGSAIKKRLRPPQLLRFRVVRTPSAAPTGTGGLP